LASEALAQGAVGPEPEHLASEALAQGAVGPEPEPEHLAPAGLALADAEPAAPADGDAAPAVVAHGGADPAALGPAAAEPEHFAPEPGATEFAEPEPPEPQVLAHRETEPAVLAHTEEEPAVSMPGSEPAGHGAGAIGAEPGSATAHGGLAEQVVVSTPGLDADGVLDALGDLDRDIARAIARTVAAKLAHLVTPALLALVADELARELGAAHDVVDDTGHVDRHAEGDLRAGRPTNGATTATEADGAPASGVPAP
jgi:hypothetical protein